MAAQNGQKIFGAGRFYGTLSSSIATPNPGLVVQDISIDFKRDIKRLYGINQLPVDIASGMLSVTGKLTLGGIAGRFFNDLMIGGSLSTGQVPNIANETVTILAAATSATLANGAAMQADLGIYGATDGVPLVKASTVAVLTAGQYAISTLGVITFSSLDARTSLKASYLYSTAGGQTVNMLNQPMGKTGGFQAVAAFLWGTDKATITLPNCISSDYGMASKLDDYMKPAYGFEAATSIDAAGNDTLGTFSFAELS